MSLLQMERFVHFQRILDRLTLPMRFIPRLGKKRLVPRLMVVWFPLTTKLKTGDQVEIITNPNSFGPSRDWLNMVKTSKARNKIRQFFKTKTKNCLSIRS